MRRRVLVASLVVFFSMVPVAVLAPPAGALTGTLYFQDGFRGLVLKNVWNKSIQLSGVRWCASSARWVDGYTALCDGVALTAPYGAVDVDGGEAHFSAGPGNAFPYVWRGAGYREDPYPPTGDFRLAVRLRFNSLGDPGNPGVGFVTRYAPSAGPVGANDPGGPASSIFAVWGDGYGVTLWLDGQSMSIPTPLQPHNFRLMYVDGVYSLHMDGEEVLNPDVTTARPNLIWLGNPTCSTLGTDWADFQMDYVKVYT